MGERIAIIVAGGSGIRMGAEVPKQLLPLCGKPILVRTIEKFFGIADRIIVVIPADACDRDLVSALSENTTIEICPGGKTRFESVRNALAMVQSQIGREASNLKCKIDETVVGDPALSIIAIHDGVRPLVSRELIERAFAEAERHGTAIPYTIPVDSFRFDGASIDRNKLMAIQTPQAFRAGIIYNSYDTADTGFTDDASVVEVAGYKLRFIEGGRENIKITTPADLLIAQALCE